MGVTHSLNTTRGELHTELSAVGEGGEGSGVREGEGKVVAEGLQECHSLEQRGRG